jgi:hypothetical protein
MHEYYPDERNAHRPEKLHVGLEEMAVAVDRLGAKENLQIAEHVANDKQNHQQTRARHQVLLAQRGTKQIPKKTAH